MVKKHDERVLNARANGVIVGASVSGRYTINFVFADDDEGGEITAECESFEALESLVTEACVDPDQLRVLNVIKRVRNLWAGWNANG